MILNRKKIFIFTIIAVLIVVGFLVFGKTANEPTVIINNPAEVEVVNNQLETKSESDVDAEEESVENDNLPETGVEDKKTEGNTKETPKTIGDIKEEDEGKMDFKIINKLMSSGFAKKDSRAIDTIVIHSSYDALGDDPFSISGIISEYKQYGVSAHYLIGRKGDVYRLVEDKNVAYHAGVSEMPDGRTGVNEFSIGIEIVNTKTDKITDSQYSALNKLIDNLKSKYKIKSVVTHKQIAPSRKDDPWGFDISKIKN